MTGTGAVRPFFVSWAVSTPGSSCTFTVTVNGTPQTQLTMGKGGNSAAEFGSQAIINMPDNAQLTLRNVSTTTCAVSPNGNGSGGGAVAYLNVMRLQ